MLLSKLLLLPVAVASTVTIYLHPVPQSASEGAAVISSPVPLAQIDYDADSTTGTVTSYTPPKGTYASDHLLRIGLHDAKTGSWRGVVTSAASFADAYKQTITVHVDEKGQPYHVGFGASARTAAKGDEVDVAILKRGVGPKPALNKPVVLNADGKLDSKESEKSFLQKYWWAIGLFLLVQVLAGGGKD